LSGRRRRAPIRCGRVRIALRNVGCVGPRGPGHHGRGVARLRVDTEQLAAGEGHHAVVAGDLRGSAGSVRAAAAGIAGAAGHAGAAAAGDAWGVAWAAALSGHADAVHATGRNLAAAAAAYRETDDRQMRPE
jgi:hypothetical protein